MTKIKRCLIIIVCLIPLLSNAQEQNDEQVQVRSQLIDISNQNLLKFNRSLFHPAFSYVWQETQDLSIYSRIQWVEIENSPKSYFFNYTGIVGDRVGTSISLFQQNVGILTNFGVIVNGAYSIPIADKVELTMGINVPIFRTALINSFEVTNDPTLANFEESVVVIAQPGINLTIGRFDIGIYGQNLVDYNLKTSESLTTFNEKTFSAHFIYSQPINSRTRFLDQGTLRIAATGLIEGSNASQLGATALLDLPDYGWFQAGYNGFSGFRNEFNGYSVGAGFKVSPEISVGMVYEKGIDVSSILGPTYEITVNYSFISKKQRSRGQSRKRKTRPKAENNKIIPKKEVPKQKTEQTKQPDPNSKVNTIDTFKNSLKTKFSNTETLQLREVDGVKEGFYVVANVFANKNNFNRFIVELAKKKLSPKYFYDSDRKYYYAYLERYDSEDEAEEARVSQFGGRYTGELWVLGVTNKK